MAGREHKEVRGHGNLTHPAVRHVQGRALTVYQLPSVTTQQSTEKSLPLLNSAGLSATEGSDLIRISKNISLCHWADKNLHQAWWSQQVYSLLLQFPSPKWPEAGCEELDNKLMSVLQVCRAVKTSTWTWKSPSQPFRRWDLSAVSSTVCSTMAPSCLSVAIRIRLSIAIRLQLCKIATLSLTSATDSEEWSKDYSRHCITLRITNKISANEAIFESKG